MLTRFLAFIVMLHLSVVQSLAYGDWQGQLKNSEPSSKTIISNKIHPFFVQVSQPQRLLHLVATGTDTLVPPSSEDHHYDGPIANGHWVDASAGGSGNLSILVRSENPQRLTLMEEFLHGTQSRIWGDPDTSAATTAFREWHVRDFMYRHRNMLGFDADEVSTLGSELDYWRSKLPSQY